jgi:hypothetical protein
MPQLTAAREDFLRRHGPAARAFRSDVYRRAAEVDPSSELDWYALQVGFALGRGLSAADAHEFARVMRYQLNDGESVPDGPMPPAPKKP